MPRATRIRTEALEALASELRFAPARTVLRQIESIETLATELDPDQLYPEDFVVFRVTGFRPPLDEPSMLVGGALLADLSALAERISAGGRLRAGEHDEGTLGLEDLVERWGVSRKTVERARRRGLIARRVRRGDGKEVLRFSRRAVERYEEAHADEVEGARSFARTDDATSSEIESLVRALMQNRGLSRTAASREAADRFGVSPETVRRILTRDEPDDRADADDIARRDALGEAVASISESAGLSEASVRRIVKERRLASLPTRDALAVDASDLSDRCGAIRPAPVARTTRAFAELARGDGPMSADEERTLASSYHARLLEASGGGTGAHDLDVRETALRRAFWLKRELVRRSRRLVLASVEERAGVPFERLNRGSARRAHRAGMAALSHAVDRFDPTTGGRLAAGASLEIGRALASLTLSEGDTESDDELDDWTSDLAPGCALLLPREILEGAGRLDTPARDLIERRYGLTDGLPSTLDTLAREGGLSRLATARRVRQAVRLCVEGG